jgi:hypothetical protein
MAEANTARAERTTPYLRPNQVENMKRDAERQRGMLAAPPYIRNAVDAKLAQDTLRRIERQLESDAPKPYEGSDRDWAVKEEARLREEWTAGMPTAAEMRRAPPGALEKHMAWEKRNAVKIDRWKNMRLRMAASGMLPSEFEGSAIANIELYRPVGGPQEMGMDNAQIPGKQFYGGTDTVLFTEFEMRAMERIAPNLIKMLAFMSADQRRELKSALQGEGPPEPTLVPTIEQIDALAMNDLRERCRALELEVGGTKDELRGRLYEAYGLKAN